MGVVKRSIFTVFDHFPEYREKIRCLFRANSGFHALCEDFNQCREALHYWSQSDKTDAMERREEYMILMRELEHEIIRFLNESE